MRRFTILLLALAVAAAACSGGDEGIAGVGDTVLKRSEIDALYEDEQPVDDSYRATLFGVMALEALNNALEADYGVTVDPAKVREYLDQLETEIETYGYTAAEYLGVENASMQMVRFNAEILAVRAEAVQQLMADPEVVDGLFSDPRIMTTVCVKHILVGTLEEAETVMARLAAGEDFATVADEVSLDTSAEGGDLGCTLAGDFVGEFTTAAVEAPLNEVSGPVESEFGFHVLIVGERTEHTRQEYEANPLALLSELQLSVMWANYLEKVLTAADAWVAEDIGTWTPTGIDAPGATTTTGAVETTTTSIGTTTTTVGTTTTGG